jgi:hypothetical protein
MLTGAVRKAANRANTGNSKRAGSSGGGTSGPSQDDPCAVLAATLSCSCGKFRMPIDMPATSLLPADSDQTGGSPTASTAAAGSKRTGSRESRYLLNALTCPHIGNGKPLVMVSASAFKMPADVAQYLSTREVFASAPAASAPIGAAAADPAHGCSITAQALTCSSCGSVPLYFLNANIFAHAGESGGTGRGRATRGTPAHRNQSHEGSGGGGGGGGEEISSFGIDVTHLALEPEWMSVGRRVVQELRARDAKAKAEAKAEANANVTATAKVAAKVEAKADVNAAEDAATAAAKALVREASLAAAAVMTGGYPITVRVFPFNGRTLAPAGTVSMPSSCLQPEEFEQLQAHHLQLYQQQQQQEGFFAADGSPGGGRNGGGSGASSPAPSVLSSASSHSAMSDMPRSFESFFPLAMPREATPRAWRDGVALALYDRYAVHHTQQAAAAASSSSASSSASSASSSSASSRGSAHASAVAGAKVDSATGRSARNGKGVAAAVAPETETRQRQDLEGPSNAETDRGTRSEPSESASSRRRVQYQGAEEQDAEVADSRGAGRMRGVGRSHRGSGYYISEDAEGMDRRRPRHGQRSGRGQHDDWEPEHSESGSEDEDEENDLDYEDDEYGEDEGAYARRTRRSGDPAVELYASMFTDLEEIEVMQRRQQQGRGRHNQGRRIPVTGEPRLAYADNGYEYGRHARGERDYEDAPRPRTQPPSQRAPAWEADVADRPARGARNGGGDGRRRDAAEGSRQRAARSAGPRVTFEDDRLREAHFFRQYRGDEDDDAGREYTAADDEYAEDGYPDALAAAAARGGHSGRRGQLQRRGSFEQPSLRYSEASLRTPDRKGLAAVGSVNAGRMAGSSTVSPPLPVFGYGPQVGGAAAGHQLPGFVAQPAAFAPLVPRSAVEAGSWRDRYRAPLPAGQPAAEATAYSYDLGPDLGRNGRTFQGSQYRQHREADNADLSASATTFASYRQSEGVSRRAVGGESPEANFSPIASHSDSLRVGHSTLNSSPGDASMTSPTSAQQGHAKLAKFHPRAQTDTSFAAPPPHSAHHQLHSHKAPQTLTPRDPAFVSGAVMDATQRAREVATVAARAPAAASTVPLAVSTGSGRAQGSLDSSGFREDWRPFMVDTPVKSAVCEAAAPASGASVAPASAPASAAVSAAAPAPGAAVLYAAGSALPMLDSEPERPLPHPTLRTPDRKRKERKSKAKHQPAEAGGA